MDGYSSDLIRPLKIAENYFLEVLISRFSLRRRGEGNHLDVWFDEETSTIWNDDAKDLLRANMPDFQAKAALYRRGLDAFLLENIGRDYDFDDPQFRFRYASGGTLPLLRVGGKEYYCLFYRDKFPIGWNIANGGCDNRSELLSPVEALDRELREELIILHPAEKKWYVFEADAGKPLDHPDFAAARRFWQEIFRQRDFLKFEELTVPLKWLDGPDSLTVQIGSDPPRTTSGCFLNINADDFGIEVDRVAMINVDEDAVLCDGEITEDRLVNAPVGLFDVDALNDKMERGSTDFRPDYFFFNGQKRSGNDLDAAVRNEFLPHIEEVRTPETRASYVSCRRKLDLCPVTRSLIRRFTSFYRATQVIEGASFEMFISFGGPDATEARTVYDFLAKRKANVFFSGETLADPDFNRTVNSALDSAKCLIAVGTSSRNLERRWVRYECNAFHNDILMNRKPNGKIISFISGFDHHYLPLPLRAYQVVTYDQTHKKAKLEELARLVF